MPTLKESLVSQASALSSFEAASLVPLPPLSQGLSMFAQSLPATFALPTLPTGLALPGLSRPTTTTAAPPRNSVAPGVAVTRI